MPHLIDLTMTVSDHFRWRVERRLKEEHARGDQFQITWLGMAVHGFTHVDAPRHMVPGGPTTDELTLDRLCGRAAIVDLTGVEPDREIPTARFIDAASHVAPGDIVVLKTCWETLRSPDTPAFWRESPWLTRAACEFLLDRKIKALAVDFPQDEPIRHLLDGVTKPIAEFVSHDVLLRNGIPLIEYVCKLAALRHPFTQLYAFPLKIADADGAPARVVAVEDDRSPAS